MEFRIDDKENYLTTPLSTNHNHNQHHVLDNKVSSPRANFSAPIPTVSVAGVGIGWNNV